MDLTVQNFRERYDSLETEELLELYKSTELTELAYAVLVQVLEERGISQENLPKQETEETIEQHTYQEDGSLSFLDLTHYIKQYESMETVELVEMIRKRELPEAAWAALTQVLADRGISPETKGKSDYEKEAKTEISSVCRFRKICFKILEKRGWGCYRGKGRLVVNDKGLIIFGRHVRSLSTRLITALVIGFILCALTAFLLGTVQGILLILIIISMYFLVEYGTLKRQDISVSWESVRNFAADPKHNLVAISFDGYKWHSPVVLSCENWADILSIFRRKVPDKDATHIIDKAENPHVLWKQIIGIIFGSMIVLISLRFLGVLAILVGLFVFLDAWHSGIYQADLKYLLNISPMEWGIASMLLPVIFYPIYVLYRYKLKTKKGPVIYWLMANIFGIAILVSYLLRIM